VAVRTLEGVGSGREVARLSQAHDAYRWICGGVSVNYHALNDFRSANEALMDELLTDNVAALAQPVRSAWSGWRRTACACVLMPVLLIPAPGQLAGALNEAGELVRTSEQPEGPGQASDASRRQSCARPRMRRSHSPCAGTTARVPRPRSATGARQKTPGQHTDPDARVMKMADGGFRPA